MSETKAARSATAETKVADHTQSTDGNARQKQLADDLESRVAKLRAATNESKDGSGNAASTSESELGPSSAAASLDSSKTQSVETKKDASASAQSKTVSKDAGKSVDSNTGNSSPPTDSADSNDRDQSKSTGPQMSTLLEKQQQALGAAKKRFLEASMHRDILKQVTDSLFFQCEEVPTVDSATSPKPSSRSVHAVSAKSIMSAEILVLEGTGRNIVIRVDDTDGDQNQLKVGDEVLEINGISLEPLAQHEVSVLTRTAGGAETAQVRIARRVYSPVDAQSISEPFSHIWNFAFQYLMDDVVATAVALIFPNDRIRDLDIHERTQSLFKHFQAACNKVNSLVATFTVAATEVVESKFSSLINLACNETKRLSQRHSSFVVTALTSHAATLPRQDAKTVQLDDWASIDNARVNIQMCETMLVAEIHRAISRLHDLDAARLRSSDMSDPAALLNSVDVRGQLQCLVTVSGHTFRVECLSAPDMSVSLSRQSNFGWVSDDNQSSWNCQTRFNEADFKDLQQVFCELRPGHEAAPADILAFFMDGDGDSHPMAKYRHAKACLRADNLGSGDESSTVEGHTAVDTARVVINALMSLPRQHFGLCLPSNDLSDFEHENDRILRALPSLVQQRIDFSKQDETSHGFFSGQNWGCFNPCQDARLYLRNSSPDAIVPNKFPRLASHGGWLHLSVIFADKPETFRDSLPPRQNFGIQINDVGDHHTIDMISSPHSQERESPMQSKPKSPKTTTTEPSLCDGLCQAFRAALRAARAEYVRQLSVQVEAELLNGAAPGTSNHAHARLSARFVLCNYVFSELRERLFPGSDDSNCTIACIPIEPSPSNTKQQREDVMASLSRRFEHHPCVASMTACQSTGWLVYVKWDKETTVLSKLDRNVVAERFRSSINSDDSAPIFGTAAILSFVEPHRELVPASAVLRHDGDVATENWRSIVSDYNNQRHDDDTVEHSVQRSVRFGGATQRSGTVEPSHHENQKPTRGVRPWLDEPSIATWHDAAQHNSLVQPPVDLLHIVHDLTTLHSAVVGAVESSQLSHAAKLLLSEIVTSSWKHEVGGRSMASSLSSSRGHSGLCFQSLLPVRQLSSIHVKSLTNRALLYSVNRESTNSDTSASSDDFKPHSTADFSTERGLRLIIDKKTWSESPISQDQFAQCLARSGIPTAMYGRLRQHLLCADAVDVVSDTATDVYAANIEQRFFCITPSFVRVKANKMVLNKFGLLNYCTNQYADVDESTQTQEPTVTTPQHKVLLHFAAVRVLAEMMAICLREWVKARFCAQVRAGNQSSSASADYAVCAVNRLNSIFAPLTFIDEATQTLRVDASLLSDDQRGNDNDFDCYASPLLKQLLLKHFGSYGLRPLEVRDQNTNIFDSLIVDENIMNSVSTRHQAATFVLRRSMTLLGLPPPGIQHQPSDHSAGAVDSTSSTAGETSRVIAQSSSFALHIDSTALLLHMYTAGFNSSSSSANDRIRLDFVKHAQMQSVHWLEKFHMYNMLLGPGNPAVARFASRHAFSVISQPGPPIHISQLKNSDKANSSNERERVRALSGAHRGMQTRKARNFIATELKKLGIDLDSNTTSVGDVKVPLIAVLLLKILVSVDLHVNDCFVDFFDAIRGPLAFRSIAPGAENSAIRARASRCRQCYTFVEALESRGCHGIDHPLAAFASALVVSLKLPAQLNLLSQFVDEELVVPLLAPNSNALWGNTAKRSTVDDCVTTARGSCAALECYRQYSELPRTGASSIHSEPSIWGGALEPLPVYEQYCFAAQLLAQVETLSDALQGSTRGRQRGISDGEARLLVRNVQTLWSKHIPRPRLSNSAGNIHAAWLHAAMVYADSDATLSDKIGCVRSFMGCSGGYSSDLAPLSLMPCIFEHLADRLIDSGTWASRMWQLYRIPKSTGPSTYSSRRSNAADTAGSTQLQADIRARADMASVLLKKGVFVLEQRDSSVKRVLKAGIDGKWNEDFPAVKTNEILDHINLHRIVTKLAFSYCDMAQYGLALTQFNVSKFIYQLLDANKVALRTTQSDAYLDTLIGQYHCYWHSDNVEQASMTVADAIRYVDNHHEFKLDNILCASLSYAHARALLSMCVTSFKEAGIREDLSELQVSRLSSHQVNMLGAVLNALVNVCEHIDQTSDADEYLLQSDTTQPVIDDVQITTDKLKADVSEDPKKVAITKELEEISLQLVALREASSKQLEELKQQFLRVKQDKKQAEADGDKKAVKKLRSQVKELTKQKDHAKTDYASAKKELQKKQKKLEKRLKKISTTPSKSEQHQARDEKQPKYSNFRSHLDAVYLLLLPSIFPGLIRIKVVAALLADILRQRTLHTRLLKEVSGGLRFVQTTPSYFPIKFATVMAQVARAERSGNTESAVEILSSFAMELVNNVSDRNFWCCILVQRRLGQLQLTQFRAEQQHGGTESSKKLDRSADSFAQATNIAKQRLGNVHPETLRCKMHAATLLQYSQTPDDSKSELQRLLQVARQEHGEFAAVVISLHAEIGHVASSQNDHGTAAQSYAAANVAFKGRGGGEGDVDLEDSQTDSCSSDFIMGKVIADVLPLLADIKLREGEVRQCLSLYNDLLESQERIYGAQSPQCARTLVQIGRVQIGQGNRNRGVALLTNALGIYEVSYGEDSSRAVSIRNEIGRLGGTIPAPKKSSLGEAKTQHSSAKESMADHEVRTKSKKSSRRVLIDDDDVTSLPTGQSGTKPKPDTHDIDTELEDAISAALRGQDDRKTAPRSNRMPESKTRSSPLSSPNRRSRGAALRSLGNTTIETHRSPVANVSNSHLRASPKQHQVEEAHADTGQASRTIAHMMIGQTGSMSEGRRLASQETKRSGRRSESKSPHRSSIEGKSQRRRTSRHSASSRVSETKADADESDNDDLYVF